MGPPMRIADPPPSTPPLQSLVGKVQLWFLLPEAQTSPTDQLLRFPPWERVE
ncbi:hypothetical protein KSP39_PZI013281 [Platanthera zijinensis]|uniref:Uncharacterized protein n=1 Tax=Platanthera zijinensis TaxID=2320716 RepID=A0AAP0BDG8_9ASPA